jgi:hypothetical protein
VLVDIGDHPCAFRTSRNCALVPRFLASTNSRMGNENGDGTSRSPSASAWGSAPRPRTSRPLPESRRASGASAACRSNLYPFWRNSSRGRSTSSTPASTAVGRRTGRFASWTCLRSFRSCWQGIWAAVETGGALAATASHRGALATNMCSSVQGTGTSAAQTMRLAWCVRPPTDGTRADWAGTRERPPRC